MSSIRERIVKLAQLKFHVSSQDFADQLDSAVEVAWGLITSMYAWDFMMCGKPYAISATSGTPLYKLNNDDIGILLFIANANGVPIWTFRQRQLFNRILAGSEDIDSDTVTGTTQIFTTEGSIEGKLQLRVYPEPSSSSTVYLYYTHKGTLNNLSLAPTGFEKLLLHAIGSMIAPPVEYQTAQGILRWKALTDSEDEMFQFWLDKLRGYLVQAVTTDHPVYIEPGLAAGIDEANSLTGV